MKTLFNDEKLNKSDNDNEIIEKKKEKKNENENENETFSDELMIFLHS